MRYVEFGALVGVAALVIGFVGFGIATLMGWPETLRYQRIEAQYNARIADAFRAKYVKPGDVPVPAPTEQEKTTQRKTYIKHGPWKDDYGDDHSGGVVESTGTEANLIGSQTDKAGIHLPLFDFDFQCDLVPSKTKGHFHLYTEKEVDWNKYKKVLEAMAEAGLLEKGWVNKAKKDGRAYLRKPEESEESLATRVLGESYFK